MSNSNDSNELLNTHTMYSSTSNSYTNSRTISSNFQQQTLPAMKPKFNISPWNYYFMASSVLFAILGGIHLSINIPLHETSITYTDCKPVMGEECLIEFSLDRAIKGDVYVYYSISNLFQNHRRFLNSRSAQQLLGKPVTVSDLASCGDKFTTDANGKMYSPCGAFANSVFNDTIKLSRSGKNLEISRTNIAWPADINRKFGVVSDEAKVNTTKPRNWPASAWMKEGAFRSDEPLMVWMRPAIRSNFRKLYGKVANGLDAGRYILNVINVYPTKVFGGEKSVILANMSGAGGRNINLGIFSIALSVLHAIIGVFFTYLHKVRIPK